MSSEAIVMTEQSHLSPVQIRDLLQRAVIADLLGPAYGPEEIVKDPSVRDRYLVGRLGPQGQRWMPGAPEEVTMDDVEGELDAAGSADDEDGVEDIRPPQAVSMQPSTIGMSFVVAGSAQALRITARWGRYKRVDAPSQNEADEADAVK